ncbi:unnamed protein product [Taenia asiatica]|uniref:Uncharacterized protein n=1 Tax=Taenia asiatica TaxID=60517 RepID=A0A3P6QCD3_TAEAS|nr:unnamed protein product [Taenia asiatica]
MARVVWRRKGEGSTGVWCSEERDGWRRTNGGRQIEREEVDGIGRAALRCVTL